jgi:hypothetical protein
MKFTKNMLAKRMAYSPEVMLHRNNQLNYYVDLINRIAPEEVNTSWVENFIFILPKTDFFAFRARIALFESWIANSKELLESDPALEMEISDLQKNLHQSSRVVSLMGIG